MHEQSSFVFYIRIDLLPYSTVLPVPNQVEHAHMQGTFKLMRARLGASC